MNMENMEEIHTNIMNTDNKINSNINQIKYTAPNIETTLKTGIQGNYLGKNIKYGNNVYYLSNKGALKLYPDTSILSSTLGRNGCPTSTTDISDDPTGSYFRENNPYVFTGTPMSSTGDGYQTMGQSCGNAGANVYVEEKPAILTEYRGCMNSNLSVGDGGVEMKNIGDGKLYTFDQCKELAGSCGYTSFSVNTSQTLNKASEWISANEKSVKSFFDEIVSNPNNTTTATSGELFNMLEDVITSYKSSGICYASRTPMEPNNTIIFNSQTPFNASTINIPLINCSFLDSAYEQASKDNTNAYNGHNIWFTIDASGNFFIMDENTILAKWETDSATSKCANGGGVNLETLTATYGANCATKCTIGKGNYTTNALKNINGNSPSTEMVNYWNTANPTFNVGTTWANYEGINNPNNTIGPAFEGDGDPCSECNKDYSITYQCGKDTPFNTINIAAPADGQPVELDCSDNFWNCFSGLGISDEGDVKALRKFYGGSGEITADLSSLYVPAYNDQFSGTLFANPGILQNENWIKVRDSKVAQNIRYNNQVYNVLQHTNGLSPGQILVSPSGTCYLELGTNGFLSITYYVQSTSCNNSSGNYVGVVNDVPGTLMWGQPAEAPDQYAINEIVSKPFLQNYGKKGYVDDNLVLHEYPENMLPTYSEAVHVNAIGNSKQIGSSQVSSSKQCITKCNGDPACNFFEFSGGNQCTYYNTIGSTGDSFGNVLYTKIQPKETNNNCPFMDNVNKISTSDWEYYVKGETMTPSTSCFTKNNSYLNNEIDDLQKTTNTTQKELLAQTAQTDVYLNNWNNSSTDFEEIITKTKNLTNSINKMKGTPNYSGFNSVEGFNTIGTTQSMLNESLQLQVINRYRNIFWTLLAITLIIMTLRLIQLYSK